jgi:thiamine pyrophosphate-dependent acetolactate synthase large subunit-like protein
MVVLIWNDSEYGLITWHQLRRFGRPSHIEFNNPDSSNTPKALAPRDTGSSAPPI